MIRLQEMNDDAFRSYLEGRIQRQARMLVDTDNCPLQKAIERARNACQAMLPNGLESEDSLLLSVIEGEEAVVGDIWVGTAHEGPHSHAEIRDLTIHEEFRRKGYGHQAMAALEKRLCELGMASVLLWLKPQNHAGQALCRKSGFRIVGSFMRKTLPPSPPRAKVVFEPMSKADLRTYRAGQIQRHAEMEARDLNTPLSDALEKARREYDEFFPGGVAPKDVHLFTIVDPALGSRVGIIWFGMHEEGPELTAFVEDFLIHEEFRRRGYGTQSLLALERKVRELGVEAISLFVQAHNQAAERLYARAGFSITGIETRKRLIPST
jgi:ribosomal protein S18 acetylase RimI-like enzyme